MDGRVTPPKRVTSPTWGPPPPCKQALRKFPEVHVVVVQKQRQRNVQKSVLHVQSWFFC